MASVPGIPPLEGGSDQNLVSSSDILRLSQLAAGWGLTLLIPRRLDPHLLSSIAWAYSRLRPARVDEIASEMSRVRGLDDPPQDLRRYAMEYNRMRIEGAWDHLRRLHRPPLDAKEAPVEGLDTYRAAVAGGSGVILWRMRFCSSPIVNAGLYHAGVRMTHLSSPTHGLVGPGSSVGRRLTGPLYARAERWYLEDRILKSTGRVHGYLKDVLRILEGGGTVSVFGEYPGRQSVSVPFLNGTMPFAAGPPGLSYRVGSPLLPVHAYRLGAQEYRVVIEDPIEVSRREGRAAFIEAAVSEYARRLERNIVEHPSSWLGWGTRSPGARRPS